MFTNLNRNRENIFVLILVFCFVTAFSVLLYVDRTSAQSLPEPPINENEVEDLNLFIGASIGGQSNILLYVDFSQSMGTNKAGVQIGNWDQSYPIEIGSNPCKDGIESGSGNKSFCTAGTCALGQKITVNDDPKLDPEGFAVAHCAANATGITTELVDKDGGVIHSAYDTITITTDFPITFRTIRPDATIMRTTDGIVERFNSGIAYEGVFGGCGSRACTRSKFGTCENRADFNRFLTCIDIAYSDVLCPTCPATSDETVVISVFANAAEVNCGVESSEISSILGSGLADTDIVTTLKSGLRTECNTDRKRIWAAAAMDNYANFLNAEAIDPSSDDLKTCGAQHCITVRGTGGAKAGSPNETNKNSDVALDQSCNNETDLGPDSEGIGQTTDELARFAVCMEATGQKQPTVRTCSTGGTDGPFCSPGQNGSTRADAMMTVVAQILDRDSSVKTRQCNDTDRLFNGTDSQISCFNYLNTPFRDLGDQPQVSGGSSIPTVSGSNQIEGFFTPEDEALATFRLGSGSFLGLTDDCSDNPNYNSDQGGLAGGSTQRFANTLGEFTQRVPEGRTALANAIGFDDRDASNSNISDDIIGIYRVALQTDNLASCRAHFAILITDGEDNCSGDCSSDAAFGAELASCDDDLPPATGNSNRRSTLQAASYSRTHFARFGLSDSDPVLNPDKFIDTEILTFYVGWGVKDNPQAVRTLNAAALLGGTHTSGILLHRSPQGFLTGQKDLDGSPGVPGLLSKADIDEINSNFPWVIEMAEMETGNGAFDVLPDVVTLQDCGSGNIVETDGSCTWNGTSVFDDDFFNGTAGIDLPTALTRTQVGRSFAFFVDNPAELVAALESIFEFTRGVSTVGQSPTVPPSVTAIALRERVLLPSFTPILGEPIWQGRLALFGFLDDPDNPGGKIIVRKPRSDGEFVTQDAGVDILDADAIRAANIFTDTGALNSNSEEFFWDAGKILAEKDIVTSPRNLLTVDSTVFGTQQIDNTGPNEFDTIIYTTGLVAFSKSLDPEVFGISDTDVDPGSAGSIIPICTDVCDDSGGAICDPAFPLTADCKTCVKEDCLRDKIVDFMSGKTGLLPLLDNFGEPTLDSCTDDINDNTTRGVIGCGCPDIEVTNTNIVTDQTIIDSLANCERRLGDIFNSQAKIVQAPSLFFFDTGFPVFAQTFKDRSAVIYAGANDGFLHAFHGGDFVDVINDESLSDAEKKSPFTGLTETLPFISEGTGNELFGYAPPTFLMDSIAPDGTVDIAPDGITDITRRIFTGVVEDYDPTSPIEFQDFTIIDSGKEPLPDFRFGDFKTLVEKNLALGHLGSNVQADVNNFQRAFFDGSPFIVDVFLDGDGTQTNGMPNSGCTDLGSLKTDGNIDICGREWHTVLISGFRNGGGGLTALDITNMECANDSCTSTTKRYADGPDYPQHLWTVFDRQMGNTWSQPKAARVRVNFNDKKGVDRWVIFAGGGLEPVFTNPIGNDDHRDTAADESANTLLNYEEDIYRGSAFYAIDIATGKIIFKFDKTDNSNFVCDVPADPNVIDINGDGFIDLVYIGDKCGRLWRFDVSEPIEAGVDVADGGIGSNLPQFSAPNWVGSPVFCANDPDAVDGGGDPLDTCLDSGILRNPESTDTLFPIFFAPTTVIDNLGKRHVVFQTGDRAWPSNEDKFGYLYNFIDEYIPSFIRGAGNPTTDTFKTVFDIDGTIAGTALQINGQNNDQEFTITGSSTDGEFLVKFANGCDTTNDINCDGGEKGIGTPIVISGVLLFTTFKPDTGDIDECTAGLGSGRIFGIDFITGLPSLFRVPGAQALIGGDTSIAGVRGGEGMPTPPQISYSSTGTITMTLAFSGSGVAGGAQFLIWELPRLPASTQTLYWEEVI